jgi:Cytochrome P460
VPPDFRERMARVVERAPSHGHAERFDAVVWANDVGRAAWDGGGDLPGGSMLVEEAIERTQKGDRPAGLLVMKKEGETWRFIVVDAAGNVAKEPQEALCAACHRDAPRDYVFRLK